MNYFRGAINTVSSRLQEAPKSQPPTLEIDHGFEWDTNPSHAVSRTGGIFEYSQEEYNKHVDALETVHIPRYEKIMQETVWSVMQIVNQTLEPYGYTFFDPTQRAYNPKDNKAKKETARILDSITNEITEGVTVRTILDVLQPGRWYFTKYGEHSNTGSLPNSIATKILHGIWEQLPEDIQNQLNQDDFCTWKVTDNRLKNFSETYARISKFDAARTQQVLLERLFDKASQQLPVQQHALRRIKERYIFSALLGVAENPEEYAEKGIFTKKHKSGWPIISEIDVDKLSKYAQSNPDWRTKGGILVQLFLPPTEG